ncbi:hypothetical protein [Mariniphaga sediminis]|uniref:hypothetical protein n=1 Tax=Mariniphaga sediminis TaxID=1628158 RepID=UPI0035698AE4
MLRFIYKTAFVEFFLLVVFTLLVWDFTESTITGDGKGYYDYLPSTFIHQDIFRINDSAKEMTAFENRRSALDFYLKYEEKWVNRYPCGTAVLQSPFFICTWLMSDTEGTFIDGYPKIYHRMVFFTALFYLLLSLVFLKKLLELYGAGRFTIFLSQILMIFATSITQYASANSAFSHVYSLFAITAFLFFTKEYFMDHRIRSFLVASVLLGLVVILRNINGVILFFVPFLAGSWKNLGNGILVILRKPLILAIGLLLFFALVFIQLFLWYAQTGHLLLYSYQGDGFNFLDPQFINILLSYRKGLFIYTPVLFLGIVGLVWLFLKRQYYFVSSWLVFFVLLTYLLSSWEWWYYGRSYGLRAYIDFYAIFFIPFAILFGQANRWGKGLLLISALLTIPLNLIQNYQYQNYIIHGTGMNKARYWKVFLKTHDSYKGLFFKQRIDNSQYKVISEYEVGDITASPDIYTRVWTKHTSEIENFGSVKIIRIAFENEFKEENHCRLLLEIKDDEGKMIVYHRPYFIHFAGEKFNQFQKGMYNFELPKLDLPENQTVIFSVLADKNGTTLGNVRLQFLSTK